MSVGLTVFAVEGKTLVMRAGGAEHLQVLTWACDTSRMFIISQCLHPPREAGRSVNLLCIGRETEAQRCSAVLTNI